MKNRNPLITRTLYYSKDMESFATGLKRIQNACDEVRCKVEYYSDDYGFTVRFYRHCGDGWGRNLSTQADARGTQADARGTQAGARGTQAGARERNRYEAQIIELITQNNKITRKQMADELFVGIRTIQRIINSMEQIHFVGSGKNGRWVIDKKG